MATPKSRELLTRNGSYVWARANGYRISRSAIDIAVATGELPAVRVGPRAWAIDPADLKRFLERRSDRQVAPESAFATA